MKTAVSPRVFAVAILGMMTVPVASQNILGQVVTNDERYAIFRSQDDDGRLMHGEDIRKDVAAYKSTLKAQKRAYTRAVERCRDRLRDGEEIECPDFNDTDSYDFTAPATHAAAPEPAAEDSEEARSAPNVSSRSVVRQLTTAEREQLRTYTRAGYCSKVLSDILYDLCIAIVGDDAADTIPIGIINDNVYLHGKNAAPPTSLKLRLQMMDEAISGIRGRRPDQVRYKYNGSLSR
ncbi:hypothetical protein COU78_03640 [Candidatus Peregrinibacteria bacterium CG10_big_fil_rev_8_21_14_0_10_49_24]|nr:MAG: hypothetical protein COV83_05460 [Candidatus Peregrinibacteria bacterium CG11_big_fil_rev_8_21_14_0_20_49_14]PIR51213.1 MAG: hypothetical protein COU78_03640 [Candidatus Peregrinibacteria bacterium CG10_big_fil_rev_8_21_14_0_10_49_24]PJA67251.1 MAG: hypothetical protein CO157_05795 [Candidatus Peregrinibacteria bacterium CG_4_9_14_3_um_filter_49_12]